MLCFIRMLQTGSLLPGVKVCSRDALWQKFSFFLAMEKTIIIDITIVITITTIIFTSIIIDLITWERLQISLCCIIGKAKTGNRQFSSFCVQCTQPSQPYTSTQVNNKKGGNIILTKSPVPYHNQPGPSKLGQLKERCAMWTTWNNKTKKCSWCTFRRELWAC